MIRLQKKLGAMEGMAYALSGACEMLGQTDFAHINFPKYRR